MIRCFLSLAHRALSGSTVAGRYRVRLVITHLITTLVRRKRSQETDTEDGLEGEVSEVEYNPDQEMTNKGESTDVDNGYADVTFKSKTWTYPHLRIKVGF